MKWKKFQLKCKPHARLFHSIQQESNHIQADIFNKSKNYFLFQARDLYAGGKNIISVGKGNAGLCIFRGHCTMVQNLGYQMDNWTFHVTTLVSYLLLWDLIGERQI